MPSPLTNEQESSSQIGNSPWVELFFPINGKNLPVQHGYSLYSAICKEIKTAHDILDYRMSTIPGFHLPESPNIALANDAMLRFRLPSGDITHLLPLAGKKLVIDGCPIRLGIPRPVLLEAASMLHARIVVIKGFTEADTFIGAVQKQLKALEISATCTLPSNKEGMPFRRILMVKEHTIVGFPVLLSGLSPEDSIKIQTVGIGGKQKMGAGYFVPVEG